jgi:DNA segregation ATPase FtsK/SpoIIIE-like protein
MLRKEDELKNMTKKEREEFERQKAFYYKRIRQINNFKKAVMLPYTIPKAIYNLVTQKEKNLAQAKEIERLKRVIESKKKCANYQDPNGIVLWRDEYLSKIHGVFKIGVDMEGKEIEFDFNNTANILTGGAPGGGKSNLILLVLYQALLQGSKCYIADFKGTDYVALEDKTNVIYNHKELLSILKEFYNEYEKRKEMFRTVKAKNLKEFNEKSDSKLKRTYLLIDELAEALEIANPNIPQGDKKKLEKEIEELLKSIARLGRAFGINLICGTQRPDVGVIAGQARDQFQKRICFQARSQTSQIVIGDKIASTIREEQKGRAYLETATNYIEVQTYYITDEFFEVLPNQLKIVKSEKKKLKKLDDL